MQNKFKEMFDLQNTLNVNTNGTEWTKGLTLQGRSINWYRCIYLESAEAIESMNWKHWKDINGTDDIENIKIELVDIWHFIMSQLIVDLGLNEAVKHADNIYSDTNHMTLDTELIDTLENIIRHTVMKSVPLHDFFIAVRQIEGFSMEDVYLLYIGKNCLNQFRQDNGYKDGSYIKIWDGKEDNVYMQSVLNDNPNISYVELYAYLKAKYEKIAS